MEVPVSGGVLSAEDKLAIIEVALKGWITEGEKCKEFANKLKKYVGVRHVSLCNSGSSATLLAVTAIKDFFWEKCKGKKVVTCATGFPTTVAPIIQNGLIPYFIDVNPKTLNPDLDVMLEALSRDDVCGIIQAHTLGFPYDAKAVREFCDTHGKWFIEDISDALGAEIYGKKVGSFGHIATCSFFPAHQITAGEGGCCFTDDGKVYSQINIYRDWGRDCWCLPGKQNTCNKRFEWKWNNLPDGWDHKYTFTEFGYNLKMTEMQGALGSSQMDRIAKFKKNRIDNYWYLMANLDGFYDGIEFGVSISDLPLGWEDCSPFGFPITVVSDKFTRKELVSYLEYHGVRTRPVFAGNITRQPMFDNVDYDKHDLLTGSDYVMERTFWIGCHPQLTQEQLDYTVSTFKNFFEMKGLK